MSCDKILQRDWTTLYSAAKYSFCIHSSPDPSFFFPFCRSGSGTQDVVSPYTRIVQQAIESWAGPGNDGMWPEVRAQLLKLHSLPGQNHVVIITITEVSSPGNNRCQLSVWMNLSSHEIQVQKSKCTKLVKYHQAFVTKHARNLQSNWTDGKTKPPLYLHN